MGGGGDTERNPWKEEGKFKEENWEKHRRLVKTRDKRGRLRIKQGLLLAVGKISKARGVTMCYFRRNKRVSEHEKQELQK
jgi:hypothetical protein